MRVDAQRDGRPAEYMWRPLLNTANLADGVKCSNAANIGERKTWTQGEFYTWQNSVRGQEPPKIYIMYQPQIRSNIVQSLVTSAERRWCSNEAKMRDPLKFDGVPQTMLTDLSRQWPKFTIL